VTSTTKVLSQNIFWHRGIAAYEAQGDCNNFSGTVIIFIFITNFVQTP
jgi:hypothetical protein